jgi:hypothetical protein
MLIALLNIFVFTTQLFGRGQTAPPPRFVGIGSAGDWLGNGPIFGFDDPYGEGFDKCMIPVVGSQYYGPPTGTCYDTGAEVRGYGMGSVGCCSPNSICY